MADIKVLSRHLVNKIAAGEVIERPASVVKELVENALDAGASAIDITVEDGGKRLIRVRDNGFGMGPEDLALAFASHATSKIADEQDLFSIHTMGFRGEALASVAAVSHAQIVSRRRPAEGQADAEPAHDVRCDGGKVEPVRPAAAELGTTVTVRDLFFNTPARRKFMRTTNTEFGHVVEQVARLALPHRRVSFTLTHNGRCSHRLQPSETVRKRAADFFGAELAEAMIEFADEDGPLRLYGLISQPAHARGSAKWQYFFVNGRYVRDRLLAHAVREANRGLTDPGRTPVTLVFLEMDPELVDVNVHPAKVEVRFQNGQRVHSQLLGTLREAYNRAALAPAVQIGGGPAGARRDEQPDDARRQSLKQALADFLKSQPAPQPPLDFPPPPRRPSPPGAPPRPPPPTDRPTPGSRLPPMAPREGAGSPLPAAGDGQPSPGPRPVMQIHDSYIVGESEDGLLIVDQHALHERIIYQELTQRLSAGPLAAQRLLIPVTVEVTESEKASLAERAELLERLGLELTEFGPQSVAVQKFPSLLAQRNVPAAEFLRDLLDLLAEHADDQAGELLEKVLATMACKAAVKAGQPLTVQEMNALLARCSDGSRSSSCPHGRPTTLTLTIGELEKQFKRT